MDIWIKFGLCILGIFVAGLTLDPIVERWRAGRRVRRRWARPRSTSMDTW